MELLCLGDMAGMSEHEIKTHIANDYAGDVSGFDYGEPTKREIAYFRKKLEKFNLLIAYELVGDWGCDSASWFLFEKGGAYYTIDGSHCSCFGFEGQGDMEDVALEYLQSDNWCFNASMYDDNDKANELMIIEALRSLK